MIYGEFCDEIAPQVLELQNECRNMTKEEFDDFREKILQEVSQKKLCIEFMMAVLDMIEKNIFEKLAIRVDKTA